MITKNTVFILGAGASYPYGLPLAKELRHQICFEFAPHYEKLIGRMNLTNPREVKKLCQEAKEFADAFFYSSDRSIDVWLVKNPEFNSIGKQAIISMIHRDEYKGDFREKAPHQEQDWYSYLWQRMTDEFTQPDDYQHFSENKVDLITYNYDRSLEQFLHESLNNAFVAMPVTLATEQINKLNIIHVYGQIAPLTWHESTSLESIPYKADFDELWPGRYVDNLKIIYEAAETTEVEKARELVEKAQRIFFLGFGYAKENLEILQIPDILESQRIFGTAVGFSSREITKISSQFKKRPYETTIQPWDCLRLLREYL